MMVTVSFIVGDLEHPHHLNQTTFLCLKRKRLSLVQDLIRTNSEKYLSKLVGTPQEVLIEGTSKTDPMKLFGRTFTNKIVNFSGSTDLIGQIIDVKIIGSNRNSLDGAL